MPVGELLSRISSYELTEWVAFLQLEYEEQKAAEAAEKRKGGGM
jgi:hypothetical protein